MITFIFHLKSNFAKLSEKLPIFFSRLTTSAISKTQLQHKKYSHPLISDY